MTCTDTAPEIRSGGGVAFLARLCHAGVPATDRKEHIMARTVTPAKTPTVAIARVLRGLGLKQGSDFRIRGAVKNGERYGTYASYLSADADKVIAANADAIEKAVGEAGFHFHVSVRFSAGGRTWTSIANYGTRTRDEVPVTASEDAPKPKPEPKPQYDARYTTRVFSDMKWACMQAGRAWFFQTEKGGPAWTIRYHMNGAHGDGWYLSGPGLGLGTGDKWLGCTVMRAADAAADMILVALREAAAEAWTEGTRVTTVRDGREMTGTVTSGIFGTATVYLSGRVMVRVDLDTGAELWVPESDLNRS